MFGSSTPAFGATSTPAAFGAAPSFGASPSPFGAASTPAFGAASTPAFGAQPAPFGGAASTPSMFGAATAPSLFGAPASAPAAGSGLFGAASSAAATSTFSFNTGAAATSTLSFNTGAAAGGTLFGQPATTASLFGASSTPGTGLFGASVTPVAQQPAGGGLFGGGGTQMAPATFSGQPALQPDFSAVRELLAVKDAFVAGNEKFRFHWLFLNVLPDPAQRVKPPSVDDLRWREALQQCGGADNPDRLWPVLASGFTDLLARQAAQEGAMAEHAARLDALVDAARQLARRQDTFVRERLEAVKRRHLKLSHALLSLMRKLDAVESRFGAAMGYRDHAGREAAARLTQQLAALEAQVLPASAGGLQRRVEALASAARMRGGLLGGYAGAEFDGTVNAASLEHTFSVLAQHTEALARLQDLLRRDERDLAIMAAEDAQRRDHVIV